MAPQVSRPTRSSAQRRSTVCIQCNDEVDINEVDIDYSEADCMLLVEFQRNDCTSTEQVQLPEGVAEDSIQARFNKADSTLTIAFDAPLLAAAPVSFLPLVFSEPLPAPQSVPKFNRHGQPGGSCWELYDERLVVAPTKNPGIAKGLSAASAQFVAENTAESCTAALWLCDEEAKAAELAVSCKALGAEPSVSVPSKPLVEPLPHDLVSSTCTRCWRGCDYQL